MDEVQDQEQGKKYEDDQFPWSTKQVAGALKSCLDAHGQITSRKIQSAAKRIVNQLYGATAPTAATERLEAAARRERDQRQRIEELERRVEDHKLSLKMLGPAAHKVCSEYRIRIEELEGALRKAPQVHSYALSGKKEQADAVLKDMLAAFQEQSSVEQSPGEGRG